MRGGKIICLPRLLRIADECLIADLEAFIDIRLNERNQRCYIQHYVGVSFVQGVHSEISQIGRTYENHRCDPFTVVLCARPR